MPDQAARDRRAQKKALTRIAVRRAAQRLFAERSFAEVTVADIAAAADVAVQTVFNHFPTKEDLFFADRAAWVAGPAAAVTNRRPGTAAVATAHSWLADQVAEVPDLLTRADVRTLSADILASPSLRLRQRELFRDSEDQLAVALRTTWSIEVGELPGLELAASMTSALLVTAARVVLTDQWRQLVEVPLDSPALADRVAEVQRTSRQALAAVGGDFPRLADRESTPSALRTVARLEAGKPADDRVARSIRPAGGQPTATTGSSTVSTRSATSSADIGTANAV